MDRPWIEAECVDLTRTEKWNRCSKQLDAVLEHAGKLNERELSAFKDMRKWLDDGKTLSVKQAEWVETVYKRLELDVEEGAQNLVSSGKVKVSEEERQPKFFWEKPENRPLRPPGR